MQWSLSHSLRSLSDDSAFAFLFIVVVPRVMVLVGGARLWWGLLAPLGVVFVVVVFGNGLVRRVGTPKGPEVGKLFLSHLAVPWTAFHTEMSSPFSAAVY